MVDSIPPLLHARIDCGRFGKAVNAKDVSRVVVPLVAPRSDDRCGKASPAVLYGRLGPVPPGPAPSVGPVEFPKGEGFRKADALKHVCPRKLSGGEEQLDPARSANVNQRPVRVDLLIRDRP